jgi:SAM-dependent methyltransferase
VVAHDALALRAVGDVAAHQGEALRRVGTGDHAHAPRVVAQIEPTGRSPAARSPRITHAPMQPNAPVTSVVMKGTIMPEVFQSERFFREAWPQISHAFASAVDAATEVQWITGIAGLEAGASVLDAPCGFGRHSIELGRLGYHVTGVDFSETELERAGKAAREAGVSLTLVCQDIRDMEFPSEFDLAVNLFSSIGYFSDDEDRLVVDRFWRALKPGGMFVLDTRNRDQLVRSLPPEERKRVNGWTLRIENSFDPATSRWRARWFRLRRATAKAKESAQELIGESEIRLYSAHELSAMLRPERWSRVELYGGLDGTPFSLDAPRLVLVAWK